VRHFSDVQTIFLLFAFLLKVVPSLTTSANAEGLVALRLGASIPDDRHAGLTCRPQ